MAHFIVELIDTRRLCYSETVYPRITAEQRETLSLARGCPVTVVDEVLMEKYMLLSAADFDRMVEFLVDAGVDLRDVFESQWRQG